MRFLIAAAAVCLLAIAPQPQPKPNVIPPVVLEEPLSIPDIPDIDVVLGDPEWVKAVYEVRLVGTSGRGQQVTATGTAVAVRKNKLHTAKHLVQDLYNWRCELKVGDVWKAATFTVVPQKDLAVLELADGDLTFVPVREPKYGEHVTVYGLRTKSFAQGTYAGAFNPDAGVAYAPLDACEVPVDNGDSGGGVFGDDGYLLGTISGFVIHSRQVVSVVPIVADKPLAAAKPAATPTPVPNCANGMCYPQGQQWNRKR